MKKLMIACLIFLGCSENTSPTGDLVTLSQDELSNFSFSLESSSSSLTMGAGTMTDSRDGKTYKTIVIGTQTWMAENLNYGSYLADLGYPDAEEQFQSGAQKFCYENNESNCTTDGGLYQWHTAMGFAKTCGDGSTNCSSQISSGNHQGICPSGWHMPKEAEWDVLQTYLGGSSVAGKTMKLYNTGNSSWDASSYYGGNSSGFSALPAGYRYKKGGILNRGNDAYFWEAVDNSFYASSSNLSDDFSNLYRSSSSLKRYGFSVRCAQD